MPAFLRFQDSGQVEISLSENMNDVGVRDVVNCVIASVEGLLGTDRMTTGAAVLRMTGFSLVSCCVRCVSICRLPGRVIVVLSGMIVMPVVVLSVGECGEAAENQCNAIFANSCHIGY